MPWGCFVRLGFWGWNKKIKNKKKNINRSLRVNHRPFLRIPLQGIPHVGLLVCSFFVLG